MIINALFNDYFLINLLIIIYLAYLIIWTFYKIVFY